MARECSNEEVDIYTGLEGVFRLISSVLQQCLGSQQNQGWCGVRSLKKQQQQQKTTAGKGHLITFCWLTCSGRSSRRSSSSKGNSSCRQRRPT
jgi:hypothetical protein